MERNILQFQIDKTWTLFLDRDGTLNKLRRNDYVKSWEEFEFLDGVLDSIPILNQLFSNTIIITNQQGIGKKLMKENDLRKIHVRMLEEITEHGGFIDEVYYCPSLESANDPNRKPSPGLAFHAVSNFPEINLKKSIMVGDAISDMEFGKNAGMKTVFLSQYSDDLSDENRKLIDFKCYDLATFAEILINQHSKKR